VVVVVVGATVVVVVVVVGATVVVVVVVVGAAVVRNAFVERGLHAPSPTVFVALTAALYPVSAVKPCTVHEVAPVVAHVNNGDDEVLDAEPAQIPAVYAVTELPPVAVGALQDNSAEVLPGVAFGAASGAPGTSVGVTETAALSLPYVVFFALTVTAYAVPRTRFKDSLDSPAV
jgi:hypothetical protein